MYSSDTAPEPALDRLTSLTRAALRTPVSLISLVQGDRLLFRGQSGLPEPWASTREAPLLYSFCRHVVTSGEPLVVEDVRAHQLSGDNPAVGHLGMIAYAGVPLRRDEQVWGSFCVIDSRPRKWTEEEIQHLSELAVLAETRGRTVLRNGSMEAPREQAYAVSQSEWSFRLLVESVQDYGIFMMDPEGRVGSWNIGAERNRGYSEEEILGKHFSIFYTAEDGERRCPESALEMAAREGHSESEGWQVRRDGSRFWANMAITAMRNDDGELIGFAQITRDLTERKQAEAGREALLESERQARVQAETLLEEVRNQADQLEHQSIELESQLETLQDQAAQLEESQAELEMANEDLQRTNVEVAAAEAHYHRLVETSPYAVFVLDSEGRFTEMNRAGERLLHLTRAQILGRPFAELIVPEERAIAAGYFAQVTSGSIESREVEVAVQGPSGERRLLHISVTSIREGTRITGIHGIARDITKQRRDQKALFESERSYRSLFDSLTELVYIQDLEGRFLNMNEAVLRRYGYSRTQVLGRTIDLLVDRQRNNMARVREYFRRACHGEVQRFELWAQTRDGMSFPKEVTLTRGHYFGQDVVIAVARDITERKQAEQAVERSRDFYISVLDGFPALTWRSDATGACDYFNRAWLEFTGRTLEQECGEGWTEGVHPEDREACVRTYREAFAAREPFEMEYRLRHHTGEYRWIIDIGRPLHDLDGSFIGYISGGFDIHDQRRTETQLRQAQKMEAVGRLAGGIAHDFNNVLTVIVGQSTLAQMDLPDESPVLESLIEIDDAADRAANLTRQLLAFSRQQVLQPRVVNLNAIISDVEKMLRRTLGADIELVTVLDSRLGRIQADPSQIEQILMNLAVNARDAMPTGGKLITETRNVELSETAAGQYDYEVRPGRYVLLSVSDTGTGMPKEVRERILEPFFTTKPQGKGTGLGLSTVYGIVKQSGGYIWVYSEEGQGTSFKIYLPQVDAEVESLEKETPRGGSRKSATILLAEDEPAVRATARIMLDRLGHTVIEAANGEEALRVAEQYKGDIDLLFTDVVMPLMGGRELAERLAQLRPGTKVLYASGYTDEAVVRREILEGSAAFVQKPYSADALAAKIAQVLPPPERV